MSDRQPAVEAPDARDADWREVLVVPSATDLEVALLDVEGRIVAVNAAWDRFCVDNGGDPASCGVGASYLDACAAAGDDPAARQVGAAVRSALGGDLPAPVAVDVPCHSCDELRWYDVLVSSRLADDGACVGATVTLSPSRAAPRLPAGGLRRPVRPARVAAGCRLEAQWPPILSGPEQGAAVGAGTKS